MKNKNNVWVPTHNTHLATPSLHPTWFTHQAMTWLCTHQVSLSYLWYGSINNTTKFLSNSRTLIVIETYEACYSTPFEARIPQLGFCLGKDPCHVMPIHGSEPFELVNYPTTAPTLHVLLLALLTSAPASLFSCCHRNLCLLLPQNLCQLLLSSGTWFNCSAVVNKWSRGTVNL